MEGKMNYRCLSVVLGLTMLLSLAQGQVAPNAALAKAKAVNQTWTPPRTADGHPDLQGFWANNNATPLERPKDLAGRTSLTDEEVVTLRKKAHELFTGQGDAAFGDTLFETVYANVKGTKKGFKSTDGETGDYSSVWNDERDWDNRTSLITDPPDGRLPPMTPEGQKRREANAAARLRPAASPEDRALQERCITYGSPQLVAGYQSYYQVVQTPKSVVIMTEMIHDARAIPLDAGPHLPSTVHQWFGDSRGHWEGNTLVVDTTNFTDRFPFHGSSNKLHVVERFTRTAEDTITYQFTVNDPTTWDKPWTAEIPWVKNDALIFEYACQEGNYGMANVLSGARATEKEAASK
jgi:hypothetical protein